jgi:hypothetical protein
MARGVALMKFNFAEWTVHPTNDEGITLGCPDCGDWIDALAGNRLLTTPDLSIGRIKEIALEHFQKKHNAPS